MFPNINPRQMQQAMRKLGIRQEDIDATEVIIRTADKDIIITDPSVQKIDMQGQISFQVSGVISEKERKILVTAEDIKTVAQQANISEEEAKRLIEKHNGDLAAAILDAKSD